MKTLANSEFVLGAALKFLFWLPFLLLVDFVLCLLFIGCTKNLRKTESRNKVSEEGCTKDFKN
jgi:hypothetical protein